MTSIPERPTLAVYPIETPAGPAWLGMHDGKVAWLSLGDLDENAVGRYWKGPVRRGDNCPLGAQALADTACGRGNIPLAPVGTEFQRKVWDRLTRIPPGGTMTYGELARELGSPQHARAVGGAVGANPVAWLIPCHRVVASDGGLGGYRWGGDAKAKLLAWESAALAGRQLQQGQEDRRRLEAMLLKAERFEDIARLAGSIAHDLNNLLAPIRMATELLKRKLPDESLNRYVEIIDSSTEKARSVIREILAFAKETEGRRGDVIGILQPLRELEKLVRETFPKEIEIECDFPDEDPWVRIDPHQLHRAVLNLLVNARDAITGEGRIRVQVSTHDVELSVCVGERCVTPGLYVCISVSDTGCGIREDIRERIFDPFFTTKPKDKGTGLGLASVFAIVARAGGFIDVESAVGKGSTFRLFLPKAQAPAF